MPSVLPEEQQATAEHQRRLGVRLTRGIGSIGAASLVERGMGFLAGVAAARFGGTYNFGAYSIAILTANNVGSYAGAGISNTANRFSGEYPSDRPGYDAFVKALMIVSAASAAVAALLMLAGSGWVAEHVLGNASFDHLLRMAALSAGVMILLECLRGFLIGQQKYAALLLFSVVAGSAVLIGVPAMTRVGPAAMVLAHGAAGALALTLCLVLAGKLGLRPHDHDRSVSVKQTVLEIWRFGGVQLLTVIGLNAAGWWLASQVARKDATLAQMGFFSVAAQLRNVVALAPGLLGQASFSMLADGSGEHYGGAERVLLTSTLIALVLGVLLAGFMVAALPLLLMMYGKSYQGAQAAAALSIANGVVHMSGIPAASRLSIVSLRMTGIVNLVWTVMVAAMGTFAVDHWGAAGAVAVVLVSYIVSGGLTCIALRMHGPLPVALVEYLSAGFGGAVIVGLCGVMRTVEPQAAWMWTAATILSSLATAGWLIWRANRHGLNLHLRFK